MTDRAIARAGLTAVGIAASPEAIDDLLAAYLEALAAELVAARGRSCTPAWWPRSKPVAATGAAIGLGTGNVRDGARLKLSRVGLHERFAFGGFGCDDEARDALLRVGAERGARPRRGPGGVAEWQGHRRHAAGRRRRARHRRRVPRGRHGVVIDGGARGLRADPGVLRSRRAWRAAALLG